MTQQNELSTLILTNADTAKATATIHTEELNTAKAFAGIFAVAGFGLAVTAALLTGAISAAAPLWITLPAVIAFGVATIIAVALVSGLTRARWALGALLSEWREWQATQRDALRDRMWIETNIRGNNNTVVLPGANQTTNANQTNQTSEAHFVYVNRGPQLIEGVDVRDWVYFLDRIVLPAVGHTKRAWLGTVMPSGWKIAEYSDYARLIEPLERAGLITGRGERTAGRLLLMDPDRIKAQLGIPRAAGGSVNPATGSAPADAVDVTPAAYEPEAAPEGAT